VTACRKTYPKRVGAHAKEVGLLGSGDVRYEIGPTAGVVFSAVAPLTCRMKGQLSR
jgi:hypothetical protein